MHRTSLLLVMLLAVAPACGFDSFAGSSSPAAKWIGEVAPDFSATTLDGTSLQLASLRGDVVLIDFWATWCPPCRTEIPHLRAAWEKYRGKDFRLLSISIDDPDNRRSLEHMIDEKGMSWTQVHDDGGRGYPIAQQYGVTTIPATFLLDREGIVRAVDLRGAAVEREIAKLLGD